MPKVVLTTKTIEHAKAAEGRRLTLWDANIPRFGLRVTGNGVKTWVYMYRFDGKVKRLTLGHFPAMTLADARVSASNAGEELQHGRDPSQIERIEAEKRDAEAAAAMQLDLAAEAATKRSVDLLLRRWLDEHVCANNKRPAETVRMIEKEVIPLWAGRQIDSITRPNVDDLTTAIVKRGAPVAANRVQGRIKAFFNWAVGKGIIDSSPVVRMPKLAKERSRERVLTESEMKALWAGVPSLGYPFAPFYRFLLVTVQRRTETAMMKWADIDFKKSLWTIPTDDTKPDRCQLVHLSALAIKILREVRASQQALEKKRRKQGRDAEADLIQETPWVFTVDGSARVSGFSKAHLLVLAATNTSGWTKHDLRRTAATGMAELRVPPHVVSRILNHAPAQSSLGAVGAIYNRYEYQDEKREALDAWGKKVSSLTANVRLVSASG